MVLSGNARAAGLMVLAMAAFTLNDTCMKAATETIPLFQAIVLRGLLSTAGLIAIAVHMGALRYRPGSADLRALGWRTVGEVGGTVAFLLALRHMPLANLSAIMQAMPLLVTLAAMLFLGEPVGWRRITAILVGLAGVLLIIRPGSEGFDRWSVVALISVGFVVLRDLVTRRIDPGTPSVTVALSAALSVTLMGAVVTPFYGWVTPGLSEALLLCGAAAFLIGGYLVVVMATRTGDVGAVAPFRYTSLLFAIAMGWLVFGDLPDRLTVLGSVIVVASGIYALTRERQLRRRAA
jgi:drug/metabolite transporter (DMT)-like permease